MYNKQIITILGVLSIMSMVGVAHAQQAKPAQVNTQAREEIQQKRAEVEQETQQQRQEVRDEAQKSQNEFQQEVQQKREEFRAEVQQMTASGTSAKIRDEIQQKRQELQTELQQKRQEVTQAIQKAHDDAKEKIDAARTKLQKEVQGIKDQQKQQVVLSTQDALTALNDKLTTQLLTTANRLGGLIPSIQTQIDSLDKQGKDVAAARALLSSAQDKLNAAQAAITAQVAKVYSITITKTDQLREDVVMARQSLNKDILVVRDAVKAVRDLIQQVVQSISASNGEATQ